MGKHTPGPWKAENGTQNGGAGWGCWDVFACDDVGTYVAGANRDNPDQEANARLIASAPCLLDALVELAESAEEAWGADRPCVREAFAAIRKATGATP